MEELKVIYAIMIIVGVVQVISLVVFFVMTANVSAIKKDLLKELYYPDYIEKFEEEKYLGNKEKAKEWLLRLDYKLQKESKEVTNGEYSEYYKDARIEQIKQQIEKIDSLLIELEK